MAKIIGEWWNKRNHSLDDLDIVEFENGERYVLSGWNGEKWLRCWKCLDDYTAAEDDSEYTIRPVYRFEVENIDLDELEENSEEWDSAVEVVDYTLGM